MKVMERARDLFILAMEREPSNAFWRLSLYDYCDTYKKTTFQETVNMMIALGYIQRLGRNHYKVLITVEELPKN